TWSGDFTGDRLGVTADWKAGAAVYSAFGAGYGALAIKPVKGEKWTPYANADPAGTPESYKAFLLAGATGQGKNQYTGKQASSKHVIPKKKDALLSTCDGIVVFTEPTATDNCLGAVDVTCDPPSGSILGAGVHAITCTAVDEAGNTSTCTFQVTVLAPLRIVFTDWAHDDSVPNDIETDQDVQNKFKVGAKLDHRVKLYDCTGADVTKTLAPAVTVKLDATVRQPADPVGSTLVSDLIENFEGWGGPGGVMELEKDKFRYVLLTTGFPKGTLAQPAFIRSRITVEYKSAPGVIVGAEDAWLESEP
ncbi:MAG: HYR domain-containing protein, partial [Akkermansiaceae bacterium]|nr:HYR domain-containing protein [Akkermansiaceae bacterium]